MILYIDSFIVGKAFMFMFICSYVLIHSLIHSMQVKHTHGGLSDVRRKAEETRRSTLLQTIQNVQPSGCVATQS